MIAIQEATMLGTQTSWSLVGPGAEVGLKPSFIDYVRLSLSSRVVLLLQH
jgi:hypothetical protein